MFTLVELSVYFAKTKTKNKLIFLFVHIGPFKLKSCLKFTQLLCLRWLNFQFILQKQKQKIN